jgi:hypothetical protein
VVLSKQRNETPYYALATVAVIAIAAWSVRKRVKRA